MKKHSEKRMLDSHEWNRVRYLMEEGIFVNYKKDTKVSRFYRCSKCRKSIIKEDLKTRHLFKIRGHSHNCPSRQIEFKNEFPSENIENDSINNFENSSDVILAPESRKSSMNSNFCETPNQKLARQLFSSDQFSEESSKEEKKETTNPVRNLLSKIVNGFSGFYSQK
jgi:hypothetical protein